MTQPQRDASLELLIDEGLITDPASPKGRLLQEAAHLFSVKGFERTTVRDIAKEVGIQSGSIFHHFKTKEDILKAVMTETILFNTTKMRRALEKANTPREKVLACVQCELEAITGSTGEAMGVLVYEWRCLSENNQKDVLELRTIYEDYWLSALDSAKSEGLIPGDTFILRRFLAGALSWTTTWYNPAGDLSLEGLAEEALNLALAQ